MLDLLASLSLSMFDGSISLSTFLCKPCALQHVKHQREREREGEKEERGEGGEETEKPETYFASDSTQ